MIRYFKLAATLMFSVFLMANTGCKDKNAETGPLEIPAEVGSNQVVEHYAYILSYNELHEQADWVAYELTKAEAESEVVSRDDNFRADPDVTTGSAALDDYKYSGYDRGHLIPAADNKWSETAMSESFFLSNMSPQLHEFNDGKWKYLEFQVRDWAISYSKIYVATGPVLRSGLPTIGENKVSIPEFYYKVILDGETTKAIGFIMPHVDIQDSFKNYAVSVDEVEAQTGIDFFHFLDDDTEARLESTLNLSDWTFTYYK